MTGKMHAPIGIMFTSFARLGAACRQGANRFALLVLCLSSAISTAAIGGTLSGTLDKSQGNLNDEFVYTLTAEGNEIGDIPEFPPVTGLRIHQGGTSNSYSNINGKVSNSYEVRFILEPEHAGTFVIPPVTMTIDGKQEKTFPLKLDVTKDQVKGDTEPEVFIERILSDDTPFVGEAIVAKTQIFTRVQFSQPRASVDPMTGFQKIEIQGEKNFRKAVGAFTYNVIELAEILIPSQPGDFQMPTFILQTVIPDPNAPAARRRDPFGMLSGPRGIRKKYRSQEKFIKVKPLPTKGRPTDFSGAVGRFQLKANLSAAEIPQGETTTLAVELVGLGRLKGASPPKITLPDTLKVYADKPVEEERIDRDKAIGSKSIYKFALVGNKAGSFDLGKVTFWYFDTDSGSYKQLQHNLGSLVVTANPQFQQAGAATDGLTTNKQAVKTLGEDLIGLHRNADYTVDHRTTTADFIWIIGFPSLASLCALGGLIRRRLAQNPQQRHQRQRKTKALRRYTQATATAIGSNSQDLRQAVLTVEKAFKEFVGDKLAIEGRALTTAELTQQLAAIGTDPAMITTAQKVLNDLDQVNYGGGEINNSRFDSWLNSLQQIATEVDKLC